FSELPAIDMLGLNDRYIAHHPPPDLGKGWLAHEFGNGKYVLDRHPDLVLFCGPAGRDKPCFRGGIEMQDDPSFASEYRLVTFEGATPYSFQSRIWVRLESARIGVRRSESQIVVPGFLFARGSGSIARLNDKQQLAAWIERNGTGRVERIELPTGTYCLRAEASGDVTLSASNGVIDRSPSCLKLQLPAPTVLDIEVKPNIRDVWLDQLSVIRQKNP
ncbi:MAG TPA: hypothetical protein VFQ61_37845, partial [Polyangiaceae bacterium]|nr:hypothetical protein [Polyangiaceae bacterium]